jgi:hypothetical protein
MAEFGDSEFGDVDRFRDRFRGQAPNSLSPNSRRLRFPVFQSLVRSQELASAFLHDVNGGVPNKLARGRKIDG